MDAPVEALERGETGQANMLLGRIGRGGLRKTTAVALHGGVVRIATPMDALVTMAAPWMATRILKI